MAELAPRRYGGPHLPVGGPPPPERVGSCPVCWKATLIPPSRKTAPYCPACKKEYERWYLYRPGRRCHTCKEPMPADLSGHRCRACSKAYKERYRHRWPRRCATCQVTLWRPTAHSHCWRCDWRGGNGPGEERHRERRRLAERRRRADNPDLVRAQQRASYHRRQARRKEEAARGQS